MIEVPDNFWGIPIGKEVTVEALIRDVWDPTTEEILTPKHFIGIGWGLNFYALAKRVGMGL